MTQNLKLRGAGQSEPQQFMSPEEYRAFGERFREKVKPELDRLREAQIRSVEEAKKHLVG